MDNKMKIKLTVDILTTGALLFLMPYKLTGGMVHEWLGVGVFLLFILHHILNRAWIKNLWKGRYSPLRTVQTVLVLLVLVSMLGSMVSGIMISRHVFAFLDIRGAGFLGKRLHIVCAYWGFILISLHLGAHWGMMIKMAGKMFRKPSVLQKCAARALAFAIAGYGIYAFSKREIGSYMLMKMRFIFFGSDESLVFFMLDHMAVMGLFVLIGHYFCKGLK